MTIGKRLFDLFFSSLLLLLLCPLILLIAAAVWASTPGPIFFRRLRHGRCRVPFAIVKFRTLERQDDRFLCSALGTALRRTCLDELPQLWNVLRGEMSLVGPRPLDAEESELLDVRFPGHHRRYEVTPGLTGLAQVRGLRGALADDYLTTRLEFDLEYVARRTWWLDLKVLALTPLSLFRSATGEVVPTTVTAEPREKKSSVVPVPRPQPTRVVNEAVSPLESAISPCLRGALLQS